MDLIGDPDRDPEGQGEPGRTFSFSAGIFSPADKVPGEGLLPSGGGQAAMDKGKDTASKGKKPETRPRSGSGSTPVTKNLQGEATKMAALAASASAKAQQLKMTEFMATSQGGAGELPLGPRGPATQGEKPKQAQEEPMVTSETVQTATEKVAEALHQMRQEASAVQTLQQAAGASGSQPQDDEISVIGESSGGADKDGGWQVWSNRKRRIGADLGDQGQRQSRGNTPFQLPGQPHREERGYYTSAYRRNQANADQYRSSRPRMVAALTEQQWGWFNLGVCLACGKAHQVKDCRAVTREEGKALLRAALSCPVDMRPGNRTAPSSRSRAPPRGTGAKGTPQPAQGASKTAGPQSTPTTATKRSREGEGGSGLTPEAKRARQFSDVVKASQVLYVREKDGSALTRDRYLALKSSFAYYVEDMMAKNKDPPICAGRWVESRSVVKIPMASEEDVLWMRCFLDKSYLVQSEADYNKSKGKIYVTYLKDKLEPEFTGMRMDKLATYVRFYRRQVGIEGLFEIKMAAKTPKGKAVHLIMDDKAEEIFIENGRKIPFAGAGWISFEDRSTYVARIKEQERERLKPKPSNLEKGLEAQKMGVDKIQLDDEEVVVVEAEDPAKKKLFGMAARDLGRELNSEVRAGKLSKEAAEAQMLEKTGLSLDEVKEPPSRTESSSSWSEEVEHMRSLEKGEPLAAVAEEKEDEDDEQARFELSQERDAQGAGGDHRAVGSGQSAEGAASSPSDSHN